MIGPTSRVEAPEAPAETSGVGRADSPLAAPMPLRLLGVGLVSTWDWCLTGLTFVDHAVDAGAAGVILSPALTVMEVVCLVALACLGRRLGPVSRRPALFWGACTLAVAGTALAVAVRGGWLGATLAGLVSGAMLGSATAVLMLSWAEAYARLAPGRVFLFGTLSLALAGALYLVIGQLSAPLRAAATLLVPAASFALCWLSWLYAGREEARPGDVPAYTIPWRPVVIMGVCGFAAAFVDVALFEQGTLPHAWADVAVGAGLLVAAVVMRRRLRPAALIRVGIAGMMAGVGVVAFLGVRGGGFAASLLTMASYVTMTLFTCAMLADICYRHGVASMWPFGFVLAARVLMDHLGGFSSLLLPWLPASADSPVDFALIAAVGLVMACAVLAVWRGGGSSGSGWVTEVIDIGAPARRPSERELLLSGCARAARDHGLTEREAEVLEMLVDGMSYQEICTSLLLSTNTVKTHARHAYAKLGVHTREEAAALARALG